MATVGGFPDDTRMNTTNTKRFSELQVGDLIFNHGHIFRIAEVRQPYPGVIRYKGICTPSKRNDSIRHTGYNGGTYGGNAESLVTLATEQQAED
jgi:hypothetical protein